MSRTRRGSRFCGHHLCAAVAAILLLLSVSVLHSRLGSTSSRRGLGFQKHTSKSTIPTLDSELLRDSSDATESETSNTTGAADDRIDVLDKLDEEVDEEAVGLSERAADEDELLRVNVGEDADEDNDGDLESRGGSMKEERKSGLFWDHVTGVMRRAFSKRSRAVDDLSERANFNSEEDQSGEVVFTSDDQPLDEYIGKRLDEIKSVEDVLLLKGGRSGKPSLLRDGWAPWFEKKGEFLKKDRMYRSNLDALNPLNNPLLQDPDMPSVTTLTKGDKLMQSMIWREIENAPFDGPHAIRSSMKKTTERKTLEDVSFAGVVEKDLNSFSSKQSESSKAFGGQNEPSIHSQKTGREALQAVKDLDFDAKNFRQLSTKEQKRGVFADGRRWGYFPGFQPDLSFSDFMDQFLGQSDCAIHFLMVWNTPPWTFGVRHQRVLESIFYHHRDACVVVFSETIDLDFFSDFQKDGLKVAVVMPNLDELLKDTPTEVFASVWHEWRKTKHYFIHYSELIRLAALYKYGGIYLDFDVIVLKPLYSFTNSIAMEEDVNGSSSLNGAVMAFKRQSPFIMECLHEYYSTYDDLSVRWNGADLMGRVVKRMTSRNVNSLQLLSLKIEPSFWFFPVNSQNITRYFNAESNEAETAQQDVLFEKILKNSFTLHFWNSMTNAMVPEPGSLVERLINRYCLVCTDVL